MSIDTLFSRAVCINLDRRPDRWARMRERFARHGMKGVERVSAFDGKAGDLPRAWAGSEGAYGCLRSHVAAVAAAAADGCDSLLVFEDDVEFAPDLDARFAKAWAELPPDWSFLYLGGSHRDAPSPLGPTTARATLTLSTFAYAVRRAAFPLFFGFDPATPEAIDTRLARLQPRREFHCVWPNLAWVECDYSDVQGGVSDHWYIRESLVIGDTCEPDLAGRVALVLPRRAPGWERADPRAAELVECVFRDAVPGLRVVTDGGDELPADPVACARAVAARLGGSIDLVAVAGAPVLLSRSHLIGALAMTRRHPVVSPFRDVVPLTEADVARVLDGHRRALDLTVYARERRDCLSLGWGVFRRDALAAATCPASAPAYEVPGFGLDLRPTAHRGAAGLDPGARVPPTVRNGVPPSDPTKGDPDESLNRREADPDQDHSESPRRRRGGVPRKGPR
jgi:hypothetical protein